VGLRAVAVNELRLPGSTGWPVPDALRVERVTIAPSIRSLFTDEVRIAAIEVADPYVSMLRTRGGRLRIVPTLLEAERPKNGGAAAAGPPASGAPRAASGRSVVLRHLVVSQGEIDLYDATVRRTPWRIRLIGLDATVGSIVAPALAGRMPIEVSGTIDGPSADGTLSLTGWMDPATHDLDLTARLRGVDLLAFEPYVVPTSKGRLTRGRFDLDLHATVQDHRLHAPGHLELIDLAFASDGRAGRVLGVRQELLRAVMSARNGRLAVDFQLDGDVTDPRFSLNESLNARIAAGLVEQLGQISIPGLVEGVGGAGGSALGGAGDAGKSVGAALKDLFHRR
jgi:hypothetical protein